MVIGGVEKRVLPLDFVKQLFADVATAAHVIGDKFIIGDISDSTNPKIATWDV